MAKNSPRKFNNSMQLPKASLRRSQHQGPEIVLTGTPNSNRSVRRLDALARLLMVEGEPISAVAFHGNKILVGYNSPRDKAGEVFTAHLKDYQEKTQKRLALISNYIFAEDQDSRINSIMPLILELSRNARRSVKGEEYSFVAALKDLAKVQDTMTVFDHFDEDAKNHLRTFIENESNRAYFIELLTATENIEKDAAEKIYDTWLNSPEALNQHAFFKRDSSEKVYFSEEAVQALKDNNVTVIIEEQVQAAGGDFLTIHGEVALSNYFLNNMQLEHEGDRPVIEIGVSILCCPDCANYFHLLNSIFEEYYALDEQANTNVKLPVFLTTGTHSCQYPYWGSAFPAILQGIPQIREILDKHNLQSLTQEPIEGRTYITTTSVKYEDGIVPRIYGIRDIGIENVALGVFHHEVDSPIRQSYIGIERQRAQHFLRTAAEADRRVVQLNKRIRECNTLRSRHATDVQRIPGEHNVVRFQLKNMTKRLGEAVKIANRLSENVETNVLEVGLVREVIAKLQRVVQDAEIQRMLQDDLNVPNGLETVRMPKKLYEQMHDWITRLGAAADNLPELYASVKKVEELEQEKALLERSKLAEETLVRSAVATHEPGETTILPPEHKPAVGTFVFGPPASSASTQLLGSPRVAPASGTFASSRAMHMVQLGQQPEGGSSSGTSLPFTSAYSGANLPVTPPPTLAGNRRSHEQTETPGAAVNQPPAASPASPSKKPCLPKGKRPLSFKK